MEPMTSAPIRLTLAALPAPDVPEAETMTTSSACSRWLLKPGVRASRADVG